MAEVGLSNKDTPTFAKVLDVDLKKVQIRIRFIFKFEFLLVL